MKPGELIILWVGGLLSIVALMVDHWPNYFDVRRYGSGVLALHVLQRLSVVLAIWILCVLVWVTLYKRSRTKEKEPAVKATRSRKLTNETRRAASLRVAKVAEPEAPGGPFREKTL